jgi:hypothetical protein
LTTFGFNQTHLIPFRNDRRAEGLLHDKQQ